MTWTVRWDTTFRSQFDNLKTLFNLSDAETREAKGYLYDNAVAKSTYKAFKKEFVNPRKFTSLAQLRTELFDYVNWGNNYRLHSTLDYKSPVAYRREAEETGLNKDTL